MVSTHVCSPHPWKSSCVACPQPRELHTNVVPCAPCQLCAHWISPHTVVHPGNNRYHSYCPDRFLEWGHRSPLIKQELQQYDCDLVGVYRRSKPLPRMVCTAHHVLIHTYFEAWSVGMLGAVCRVHYAIYHAMFIIEWLVCPTHHVCHAACCGHVPYTRHM
eukprot:364819-Chlamydomonas_euryale.AAC.1